MKRIKIYSTLPPELAQDLYRLCFYEDRTPSDVVEEALQALVDARKATPIRALARDGVWVSKPEGAWYPPIPEGVD